MSDGFTTFFLHRLLNMECSAFEDADNSRPSTYAILPIH